MTIETNIAIVRRYYEKGVNHKKFGVLDEILAPGFVGFKVEGVDGGRSPAQMKATMVRVDAAFPDVVVHVDDYIAAGDKVVTRLTWTGTHLGNTYADLPDTGKRVSISIVEIWRLEGGKIVENWFEADLLSLFQQVGAVPQWDQLALAKWTVADKS